MGVLGLHVCSALHACPVPLEQKVSDLLEFMHVCKPLCGCRETESRSSGKSSASALTYWIISPVPPDIYFYFICESVFPEHM